MRAILACVQVLRRTYLGIYLGADYNGFLWVLAIRRLSAPKFNFQGGGLFVRGNYLSNSGSRVLYTPSNAFSGSPDGSFLVRSYVLI